MKVLITGGGTQTPLDQMRFIGNKSSGRTAITLAEKYVAEHEVHLFLATGINLPIDLEVKVKYFTTSYDLIDLIKNSKAENFDLIIHAAAVNDYEVASIGTADKNFSSTKIPSGLAELQIKLKPAPKVINMIKDIHPTAALIGFKLSGEISQQEINTSVKRVMEHAKTQGIVQNNILERQRGEDKFTLYDQTLNYEVIQGIDHLSARILSLGARV
ncbi:MAG: hypothetical protein CME62_03935 [Halobacteriovoraceae bacterium]|nr:hypothetical protein [Halobacteriovoraceae bacterium]|tara:strand:+ start:12193 stop:12837 length:645 start_codon:yes stop_codon:yes gene_type:complete